MTTYCHPITIDCHPITIDCLRVNCGKKTVLLFVILSDDFGCNFRSVSPNETLFEALES